MFPGMIWVWQGANYTFDVTKTKKKPSMILSICFGLEDKKI